MDRSAYVLIPGAGHGGWAWQPVAERLCAAGHPALPVTLPGMGACEDRRGITLVDAVDHVLAEIDRRGFTRVSLVAHSLGGAVLAGVAARLRDHLDELIGVAAYVPLPGESFADVNPSAPIAHDLKTSTDEQTSTISLESFARLMSDESAATRRVVHHLLTPTPIRYSRDRYTGPDLASLGVAARYIAGRDDEALVLPATRLAQRLGVTPTYVPGSHEALLTRPDEVATAILA